MSYTPRLQLTLAISVLSVLCALPVAAQTIKEEYKIRASDADPSDQFGGSVAISGTTAIVGARFDSIEHEYGRGSVYLFDTVTGLQLFKLTASDGAGKDTFGGSVAISGTRVIVGARGSDTDAGSFTGSAYLFDSETGQELFKLTPDDADDGDAFGGSVAIWGTTAIVGAEGDDDVGNSTGSAYLFDTVTGEQLAKLTSSDQSQWDFFGQSVAISGTTAIVGAFGDEDAGYSSGSAYLFDTVTGEQLAKLTASDAMANQNFGISVAISGTTAIVGASEYGTDNAIGSAYLFDTVTGEQIAKLTASGSTANDQFGFSVGISGTTAIVGARNASGAGAGEVSAYLFDTVTGLEIGKLVPSDGSGGVFVAISGDTAITGAPGNDDFGANSGSAYIFNTAIPCPADLTGDDMLDFLDISLFITSFQSGLPSADFNGDGQYDFLDISSFISALSEGCP